MSLRIDRVLGFLGAKVFNAPMSDELLRCVEVEPDEPATATVVWLHGLGADGHDFEPVVPMLGDLPGVRFVFPHAPSIPVTVNGGAVMPAWYDILGLELQRRVDEDGVRLSAERVSALLVRERTRGIESKRTILAGFSQGGAIALHLGLRHPERLAGVMALSAYISFDGNLDEERHPANFEVPIFQGHGVLDPMVPLEQGVAARDRLQGLGHEVDWHEYPMEHSVCPEELHDIGQWLRHVLGLQRGPA
ncbi:MAG: phospholipase/carboxylesterase [Planctomycetota bacterium]|jgi:phospholipase/carboxylesterase